jgi:hypothetical protein
LGNRQPINVKNRHTEVLAMPLLSRPSAAARTALIYITLGSLIVIWSAIWFVYLKNSTDVKDSTWYFCTGFFLTGLTVFVIGLALGRIGRAARHAELPPPEITLTEASVDQNAAARAPLVAPVNPVGQALAPVGTAAVPGQVVGTVPPPAPKSAGNPN